MKTFKSYGITLSDRDVNIYGAPPDRAFLLYDGYLNFLRNNTYDNVLSKAFPYISESQFLFIRKGKYKSRFSYALPDGKSGSSADVNYENTIDWR